SRLYQNLVKEKQLFSDINAYNFGSLDPGMFVIEGRLSANVSVEDADDAIWEELNRLGTELISEEELTKIKNKFESTFEFSEMNLLDKAMNLAYYELLGDADYFNREIKRYEKVSREDILKESAQLFQRQKATTLYYLAK
ncbi:insulinase family protein, partial [Pseudoxanthomonas sp. SGD-10]